MTDPESEPPPHSAPPTASTVRAEVRLRELFGETYQLQHAVARGGTGSWFEAFDSRRDQSVLVEILEPGRLEEDEVAAFEAHVARLAKLKHPNIADYHVVERAADGAYVALLENAHGRSLASILEEEGAMPPRRAGRLLLQVIDALSTMHDLKDGEPLVHGRLDPAHVLISSDPETGAERAVVLDAGLGRFLDHERPFGASAHDDLRDLGRLARGVLGADASVAALRFVDRCLAAGEPDAFRDAHQAYHALVGALEPPRIKRIWPLAIPAAASAAVFVAVGLPAFRERSFELHQLPLVSGGSERSALHEPLYFGPDRRWLEVRGTGVRVGATTEVELRTQPSPEGERVAGWSAEYSDTDVMRVVAPALQSFERRDVVLEVDGGRTSLPFELVYIAPEAIEVELGVADLGERGLDGRGLDPRGQSLDVIVRGPARGEVAEVRVGSEDAFVQAAPREGAPGGDELVWVAALDPLELGDGLVTLEAQVVDHAGGMHTAAIELDVVGRPLAFEGARWQGRVTDDRAWLGPLGVPEAQVRLERPATLSWRLEDVDGVLLAEGGAGLETSFDLQFPRLHTFREDEVFEGTLVVLAEESDAVVHAASSPAGRAVERLPFRWDGRSLGLDVSLAAGRSDAGVELPDGGSVATSRNTSLLVLQTDGEQPLWVEPRCAEGPGSAFVIEPRPFALDPERRARTVVLLDLVEEGVYELELAIWRHDGSSAPPEGEPELVHRASVLADRTAPRLVIGGFEGDELVVVGDERPAITVDALADPHAVGGEIEVRWTLEQIEPSSLERIEGSAPGALTPGTPLLLELPTPWTDAGGPAREGRWRLTAHGRDAAGNESEPVELDWSVATRGPELELLGAFEDGRWTQDAETGRFLLSARAVDANGVARVSARIEDVARPERALDVEFVRVPGTSERATVWEAATLLPPAWSGRAVRVTLDARDTRGRAAEPLARELVLGGIARSRPAEVAFRDLDRSSATMRLVRDPSGALGSFYLDERPASCAEVLAFVDATDGWSAPAHWPGDGLPGSATRRAALRARLAERDPDSAATSLEPDEARAFASWVGKRLPRLEELELAAAVGALQDANDGEIRCALALDELLYRLESSAPSALSFGDSGR